MDGYSDHQDEGEEWRSSDHWLARRFLEARAGGAASSSLLYQSWLFRCAVGILLAARLAHRRWEEHHRETIRACGQAMQRSTIGPAHADLHRVDSRLSGTPELPTVACVPLFLKLGDPNHTFFPTERGRARCKPVTASSRRCPRVRRRWLLSRAHRNSAGPTWGAGRALSTDLIVDRRSTSTFRCASSLCLSSPDPCVSECSGRWHTKHWAAAVVACAAPVSPRRPRHRRLPVSQ